MIVINCFWVPHTIITNKIIGWYLKKKWTKATKEIIIVFWFHKFEGLSLVHFNIDEKKKKKKKRKNNKTKLKQQ